MNETEAEGPGNGNGGTDEFWLSVGTELIKSRVTRIDTTAEKFITGIAWFWSIYTASALAGVSLANRTLSTWQLIVAGVPSVVLMIAYLLALYALMPVYQSFDPRLPEDIRAKEDDRTHKKKARLRNTGIATVLAAASVATAIGVVLSAPEAGPTTLNSEFRNAASEDPTALLFSGRVAGAKSSAVHVSVFAKPDPATPDARPQPITETVVTTAESGNFSGETAPVALDTYDVVATWSTDKGIMTISVEVKPPTVDGDE